MEPDASLPLNAAVPGEPELGSLAGSAALGGAGALLAAALLALAYALFDGPAQAQVVGKTLLRQAWWRLPAALAMGALLHAYWRSLLHLQTVKATGAAAAVVLWSVARAFALFALFGMIALFGWLFGMAWLALLWCGRIVLRRPAPAEPPGVNVVQRWLGIPVWFVMLPFQFLPLEKEGDLTLPVTLSRAALLRWLPAVALALMFWTRFSSEDSGEPVDPRWLSLAATFWLGEFLIVALRVTPILRARRGLAP